MARTQALLAAGRSVFGIGLFVLGLVAGAPSTAGADADDDNAACKIAIKGNSPIVEACKKGGRKEASKAMKAAVKAAKAKGVVFKCIGCHADMDTYELKPTAKDDFAKLLAAASRP